VWDGRQPARTWVQKQRNVHCWKPLPSSAVKTVTENTSLCVIVVCLVTSCINPNYVYSHFITWQYTSNPSFSKCPFPSGFRTWLFNACYVLCPYQIHDFVVLKIFGYDFTVCSSLLCSFLQPPAAPPPPPPRTRKLFFDVCHIVFSLWSEQTIFTWAAAHEGWALCFFLPRRGNTVIQGLSKGVTPQLPKIILSRIRVSVTNNCGFYVWWLDLLDVSITITLDYNSSHIELLLNDVCSRISHCLLNLEESQISNSGFQLPL
jgi:hypothetical protein